MCVRADSDSTDRDLRSVVANEMFVHRYLAVADPIGHRFVRPRNRDSGRRQQVLELVGVARDSMARTIGESRVPVLYLAQPSRWFTIRVTHDSPTAAHRLQERIKQLETSRSVVAVVLFADDLAGRATTSSDRDGHVECPGRDGTPAGDRRTLRSHQLRRHARLKAPMVRCR